MAPLSKMWISLPFSSTSVKAGMRPLGLILRNQGSLFSWVKMLTETSYKDTEDVGLSYTHYVTMS